MTIPEPIHCIVRLFTTVTEYERNGLNIRACGSRNSSYEISWNTAPGLLAGSLNSRDRCRSTQYFGPFSAITHHSRLIDLIQSP